MKQSLREAYNSFYSQRDSKSASPSTGRVHKQRQSFGPTVCLINKNPQSDIQPNNDKVYILMLILEIERLNKVVATLLNSQGSGKANEESQYLKRQIIDLKRNLSSVQEERYEQAQRQNKIIYSCNSKISEYETQLKLNNRKLSEIGDQNQKLLKKIGYLEQDLSRAKAQASKANMNILMNSQSELQKSMMKQKSAMEMQVWKQKLGKYENMINEQKQFINNQKFTIDKLQNTQLEIRQRYQYQMSMLKKSNQQLLDKCQLLQRQNINKLQANSAELAREIGQRQREIEHIKSQLSEVRKQNEQLRSNLEQVSKRKSQSNQQMRDVINQMRQALQQLNNDYKQLSGRHEKCKHEISHMRKQNNNLRNEVQHLQKSLNNKISNLEQQLSNKDKQVMRLNKTAKKLKMESRNKKSFSQAQLRTNTSLRGSTADLKGIIQDVMELQDSNTRINRLIQSKSRSQVIQVQHRDYSSYTNYGL